MGINLANPLTVVLNLAMAGVMAGCLLVIWNARHSIGLLVLATVFSVAIGGVVIPFFAIAAAITVTVTDRRAHKPARQHSKAAAAVLRHFRGRPDPEPSPRQSDPQLQA